MQFQVLIKSWQALFQFLYQPSGKTLGLGDGEFAEFGAAARDCAAPERRTANSQSNSIQFFGESFGIRLRNIYDQQVLHVGGTKFAISEAVRKIGGGMHLVGSNSSPKHRSPYVTETRLFLGMNPDVIAVDVVRCEFLNCGIELESN